MAKNSLDPPYKNMAFLLGPLIFFGYLAAMEVAGRLLGLPFSILGALGAVLRQTDEPRLQRRQTLTMLLLVGGVVVFGGSLLWMAISVISRTLLITTVVGAVLLMAAGNIGTRTLRAIGRRASQENNP